MSSSSSGSEGDSLGQGGRDKGSPTSTTKGYPTAWYPDHGENSHRREVLGRQKDDDLSAEEDTKLFDHGSNKNNRIKIVLVFALVAAIFSIILVVCLYYAGVIGN